MEVGVSEPARAATLLADAGFAHVERADDRLRVFDAAGARAGDRPRARRRRARPHRARPVRRGPRGALPAAHGRCRVMFAQVLATEFLKLRRSKVTWLSLAALSLGPLGDRAVHVDRARAGPRRAARPARHQGEPLRTRGDVARVLLDAHAGGRHRRDAAALLHRRLRLRPGVRRGDGEEPARAAGRPPLVRAREARGGGGVVGGCSWWPCSPRRSRSARRWACRASRRRWP